MPAPDDAARTGRRSTRRPQRLLAPWLALCAVCVFLIWVSPEYAVVPFHLIWIGFALAYGFEAWPLGRTAVLLGVMAVLPGIVMAQRAASGEISWLETTEIPLMLLLSALVVWHVQRREAALRKVVVLAEREAATAAQRVRLGRMTSHEMRTPLTIATGYVHLLLGMEDRPEHRTDLEIIKDELARATRAGDRLLRMIQMQDRLPRPLVDVDDLLEETAQRWAAVADRSWVVESGIGVLRLSPERFRACLDTLIENALRYTADGGTVRLLAERWDGAVVLGVADSGCGLDPAVAARINARRPLDPHLPPDRPGPDARSQTGLGIGLVQEIVEARGGRVVAGRSREGGALVLLTLPLPAPSLPGQN
jgi:signal transduction histidine kinase